MANEEMEIRPLCQVGETEMYVAADGQVFPCCWSVAEKGQARMYPTDPVIRVRLNLNNYTIEEILASNEWRTMMMANKSKVLAPPLCRKHCGERADNNQGRPTREMETYNG